MLKNARQQSRKTTQLTWNGLCMLHVSAGIQTHVHVDREVTSHFFNPPMLYHSLPNSYYSTSWPAEFCTHSWRPVGRDCQIYWIHWGWNIGHHWQLPRQRWKTSKSNNAFTSSSRENTMSCQRQYNTIRIVLLIKLNSYIWTVDSIPVCYYLHVCICLVHLAGIVSSWLQFCW